jgi:hypothetical protein
MLQNTRCIASVPSTRDGTRSTDTPQASPTSHASVPSTRDGTRSTDTPQAQPHGPRGARSNSDLRRSPRCGAAIPACARHAPSLNATNSAVPNVTSNERVKQAPEAVAEDSAVPVLPSLVKGLGSKGPFPRTFQRLLSTRQTETRKEWMSTVFFDKHKRTIGQLDSQRPSVALYFFPSKARRRKTKTLRFL